MRLLVTGGAGFIGSNFIRQRLSTSDDQITVIDALTYAGVRANVPEDPRVRFVHGDITDRVAVRQAMAGHDAVVHFAAESHVDRSLLESDAFVKTNCVGTNVVCDEAVRAQVQRVLHVSTDEVYGSIAAGFVDEAAPLNPSSPYSASKASSDLLALAYWKSHGLSVTVTRSSNQFGPRQFPEKLIPHFVTTLVEGGNVGLYSDGRHRRDWLYVEDNCSALATILERGEPGEIYNVGGGNERSNAQVTRAILDCMGLGEDRIHNVSDRPGHDLRYAVDFGKAKAIGAAPTRDFETALERTVGWYLSNRDWWEPLRQRVRNR